MKVLFFVTVALSPMISIGQFFGAQVSDSIISKNNVIKCTEYDLEDSITFFTEFPNGYYWLYNKKGLLVERNAYTGGYLSHEFTVHFIYDNKDRNIIRLWRDTTLLGDISRIRIEQFDSLGNNYGYRDFGGTEKYSAAYDVENYSKTDNPDPIELVDSLIMNSQKEYFYFHDSSRTDTIEHRMEFFAKNRVDSIITTYNKKQFIHVNKQKFLYSDSNNLEIFVNESYDNHEKIIEMNKTMFSKKGLPIERWYTSFYNGEKSLTHTSFVYQYYKSE